MKNHLKTFCFLLGAGLCAFPVLRAQDQPPAAPSADNPGQPGQGPGGNWAERAQRREQRVIKALNLTADQQSKWEAINQQMMAAMQALRADTTVAQDQKHEKAKELRQSYQSQKEALLTPDQLQKYKAFMARGHHGHAEGAEANGATPPPAAPPPPPATGT